MKRTDLIAFGTGIIIILLFAFMTIGAVNKTKTLSMASYEQGCVDANISNAVHMAQQFGQALNQQQFKELVPVLKAFCKEQSLARAKACEQKPNIKDKLCIQE